MHQLSLLIIIVVISGALCKDVVLMTQCPKSKTIQIDYKGKVSITPEAPRAQNITLGGCMDFVNGTFASLKTTLFVKEVQMYLCFNERWKLVGEKHLHERCYFTESDKHGFYEYSSYLNNSKKIEFFRRAHNKSCPHFSKIDSDVYHVDNGHNLSNSPDTSNRNTKNNNNNNNNNRNNISNNNLNNHRRHRHGSQAQQVNRRRSQQRSKELALAGGTAVGEHPKRTRNNGNRRKKMRAMKNRRLHHAAMKTSGESVGNFEKSTGRNSRNNSNGSSFSNVHDEYSNDDASAIVDAPMKNSSTEIPNPSSRKYSNRSSNASNGNRNINNYGRTNRKRITSSSLSSINNANYNRDNKLNNKNDEGNDSDSTRSISSNSGTRMLNSRTKKYYNNKSTSSLLAGSKLLSSLSAAPSHASAAAAAAASSLQSITVDSDQYHTKSIAGHFKSPAVITPEKRQNIRNPHRKKFQQRPSY